MSIAVTQGSVTITVPTQANAQAAANSAFATELGKRHYTTRALFVASEYAPAAGTVVSAGGVQYVRTTGATAISDLEGWLPFGDITPLHWGAVADGNIDDITANDSATDNTAAFAAMFAYSPVASSLRETTYTIPQGVYCLTDLTITNKTRFVIDAQNAVLYGTATTAKDHFIHMHNVSRFRQTGWLRITSDGNRATPLYSTNYDCALRFTSNTDAGSASPYAVGSSATQLHYWYGLEISMFENGIVSGYDIGATAHQREAQDSLIFVGAQFRSVMRPVYQNVDNSGMQFQSCMFHAQQYSASSSWWDDAQALVLRNDNGRMLVSGGLVQKTDADGWGVYGTDLWFNHVSWECNATSYITGDCHFTSIDRGYVAGLTGPCFQIAPDTEGTLRISKSRFRRISKAAIASDTAPGSSVNFVDAKDAPDFKVVLESSNFTEFYFDPVTTNNNSHFVRGGVLTLSDVSLRNTSTFDDWYFGVDSQQRLTIVDSEGDSMSATADLTAKGGWTAYSLTGGHFHKITTGLPAGKTAAIAIESVGTSGGIATDDGTAGEPGRASRDTYLNFLYKRLTGTTGYMSVKSRFYDFGGILIGSDSVIWSRTGAQHTADDLDDWNRVNVPVKWPAGAAYVRFDLQATTEAVRAAFTDLN